MSYCSLNYSQVKFPPIGPLLGIEEAGDGEAADLFSGIDLRMPDLDAELAKDRTLVFTTDGLLATFDILETKKV